MAGEFGKFKDSFNKSIANIGAKASNSVEKSRLKGQLDAFNKEADIMITELGRQAYAIWREGNTDFSSLNPQFEQIKAKYDAIQLTFNELKAIEERERLASQPSPAPVYAQPQPVMNNVYSGQAVPVAQPVPVYSTPVQPVAPVAPVAAPATPVVAPASVQPVVQQPVAPVAVPVQPVAPVAPVVQAVPVTPVVSPEPVVQAEPVVAPAQAPTGCVCPNCGASFDTEINFCRMCGTKIKQ